MGQLHPKSTANTLKTLLNEFKTRRWDRPFDRYDIQALLQKKPRTVSLVLQAGIDQGFFQKTTSGYKLTPFATSKLSSATQDHGAKHLAPNGGLDNSELAPDIRQVYSDHTKGSINHIEYIRSDRQARVNSTPQIKNKPLRKKTERKMKESLSRLDEIMSRQTPNPENPDDEGSKAYQMQLVYESALADYKQNPHFKLKHQGPPTGKSREHFLQAAKLADELGVRYSFFIRSQLYWFEKWFARPPKVYELRSAKTRINAQVRVKMYQDVVRRGLVDPNRTITSRDIGFPKMSDELKFEYAESTLKTLMQNYNATEAEVMRVFAKGKEAFLYFDKKWLESNETYRQLKSRGEI